VMKERLAVAFQPPLTVWPQLGLAAYPLP
jgi:hypothetical protein